MQLPRVFYWAFGGVGFTLLTIAAVIFYNGQQAQDQYVKIEGVVVRNQFNGEMSRPVIQYEWEGRELLFANNTYTNPPAYERGEKVELFVNPDDPKDVWINTFMGRYFVLTLVGGLGLFFLGFLLLFHFVFRE